MSRVVLESHMKDKINNPVLTKSFEFALQIIEFCSELNSDRHYAIENQLIRSGTAIGALVQEAQSPQSRGDFIHKMKIAAKEAEETQYWLDLCRYSSVLPNPSSSVLLLLTEVKKLLTSIIYTSNRRS